MVSQCEITPGYGTTSLTLKGFEKCHLKGDEVPLALLKYLCNGLMLD